MGAAEKLKRVWASRREALRSRHHQGEVPDPTPLHVPGKSDRPLSLRDEMRRFVREELSKQASQHDAGTFEDEDDFEEEDDAMDLLTPYTVSNLVPEGAAPDDDLEGKPTPEDLTPEEPSSVAADAATPNPAPSPETDPNEAAQ